MRDLKQDKRGNSEDVCWSSDFWEYYRICFIERLETDGNLSSSLSYITAL